MEESREKCLEAAHHISAFWLPYYNSDPMKTGSVGAGFLISPYAKSCYPGSGFPFKRKPVQVREIERRMGLKRPVNFSYRDPLPHSVGYSVSATLSLSYSFAVSVHFSESPMLGEICRLAHIAEVESRSGLGDVSAICGGRGVVVRLTPGAPGFSTVDSLVVNTEKYRIVTSVVSRMKTADMLNSTRSVIEKAGEESFRSFLEEPSLEKMVEIGREFSRKTGMMSEDLDRELFEILRGTSAIGYFVKKGLVVAVIEKGDAAEAAERLKGKFGNARIHRIIETGVRFTF